MKKLIVLMFIIFVGCTKIDQSAKITIVNQTNKIIHTSVDGVTWYQMKLIDSKEYIVNSGAIRCWKTTNTETLYDCEFIELHVSAGENLIVIWD